MSRPDGPATRFLLLCIDALEPVGAGDTISATAAWRVTAARVMDHARGAGWPVAHLLPERPADGRGAWGPGASLAPAPAEPVFHLPAPSGFYRRAIEELGADLPAVEVVLVGASARSSVLTTAVEALALDADVAAVTDGLSLSPGEWRGVTGLAAVSSAFRLVASSQLAPIRGALRIIHGGRR